MKGGFPLAILVNLDVMMAKRKVSAGELAERIGITPANLSIQKFFHVSSRLFNSMR